MKMMGMIMFLLLPLAVLAYICWHVWMLMACATVWKVAAVAVMVAAFLLLFASIGRFTDSLPMPLATAVYETGTSSIIVMLYLFMTFLLLDVLRLLHVVPRQLLTANWWTLGGIALLMVAVFSYGNLHYRHKYRQPLTLTTGKPLSKPVRMVMVSDLHLGYHTQRTELARWVDIINAEQPDMVLIAGDIIDGSMRPLLEQHMDEEMRRLKAPVYACLGNHEYYSGCLEAQQFYKSAGIRLLSDEALTVGDVCIIGRDDRTNQHRKSLGKIMAEAAARQSADSSGIKEKYTILLDHQPYHLEQAERQGVDFQFSGHTHHGQVWPASWVTDAIYECAFGEHQRGGTRYYVSSGLGIWGGKFRIGTRSEYIVAELRSK